MKNCSIFLHFLFFIVASGRAPSRPYRYVVRLLLHQLIMPNWLAAKPPWEGNIPVAQLNTPNRLTQLNWLAA